MDRLVTLSRAQYDELVRDAKTLDHIALLLRVVNEKEDMLSPLGIHHLSVQVEETGRNVGL